MTWTAKEMKRIDPEILKMNDAEFINYSKSRIQDLPRAQRRAKERELKDRMDTMKSLSPRQMRLMVDCVNHSCGRAVQEELDKYNYMMDGCITAYLYMKNPDMTIDEARAEQDIIAELIKEDVIKYKERIESEKGDENMANKKVNRLEPEVRAYAGELIEKGINQGDAVKELAIKFPTLSKSMLTNAFKKVKEERRIELEAKALEVEKEVIAATEYIFEEDKKEEDVQISECSEESKEVNANELQVEESKEIEQTESDGLKITYRQISVEGKHNKYVIYTDYVKAGGKTFKDIQEVEMYYQEQIKLFNSEIEELKKVMAMI